MRRHALQDKATGKRVKQIGDRLERCQSEPPDKALACLELLTYPLRSKPLNVLHTSVTTAKHTMRIRHTPSALFVYLGGALFLDSAHSNAPSCLLSGFLRPLSGFLCLYLRICYSESTVKRSNTRRFVITTRGV